MTPWRLFEYMSAIGGGLFCIGASLFLIFVLYFLAFGWLKQPPAAPSFVPSDTPEPRL